MNACYCILQIMMLVPTSLKSFLSDIKILVIIFCFVGATIYSFHKIESVYEENLLKIVSSNNDNTLRFKGPKNYRQFAVVRAFKHSWEAYEDFAFGLDYLKPLTKKGYDKYGIGLSIIESLDTMWIMELTSEYEEAREWITKSLNFNVNNYVNLFEVTTRVLGGLLSAYHLSGDGIYIRKSMDLAKKLMPCFKTGSGIPYSNINLATSKSYLTYTPTSDVTSIQLEFRDLSRILGVDVYEKISAKVSNIVHELIKNSDGLIPTKIDIKTGKFSHFKDTKINSYYEYLLKQWIQTGMMKNFSFIEDYKLAVIGIKERLMTKSNGLFYFGQFSFREKFIPIQELESCFFAGVLLLGSEVGKMPNFHRELANQYLQSCHSFYNISPTFIAPRLAKFSGNMVRAEDNRNMLRPEFIESLYYFYAFTGDKKYQEIGWEIFQAYESYAKCSNGYASIGNVMATTNVELIDVMDSHWLSKTLKYFYLLFSDNKNEIDLKKYLFNNGGHLIKIRDH